MLKSVIFIAVLAPTNPKIYPTYIDLLFKFIVEVTELSNMDEFEVYPAIYP